MNEHNEWYTVKQMDKQTFLQRTFYRGNNLNLVKYYENKEIFNLSLGVYDCESSTTPKEPYMHVFYYRVFETQYCKTVGKKRLGIFLKKYEKKLYLLIYTDCVFTRVADLEILNKICEDFWKILTIINEFIQTNKYRIILDFQKISKVQEIIKEIYFVLMRKHFYVEKCLIRFFCSLLVSEGINIQKNFVEHINNDRLESVEVRKGRFVNGVML